MVWMGVGYNAKAPLIFVKAGVNVNTDVYRREVLRPVERWAKQHYGTDDEGKIFESNSMSQYLLRLLARMGLSTGRRPVPHQLQTQSRAIQSSHSDMAR